MVVCAAPGCNNSSKTGLIMRRFPRDDAKRQEWLMNMKRAKWKPSEHSVICEVHFEPHMWEKPTSLMVKKLKRDAVPTLFSILPQRRTRRPVQYEEEETESDEEQSASDSSDPSYIASSSDLDCSDDDTPRRTRSSTRTKNCKTIKTDINVDVKTTQNTQVPMSCQPPVSDVERVYNPYSQLKQPASAHPVHPDVRLSRLPFYDTLAELLKPSMLKPQPSPKLVQEETFQFYLTPQQTRDLISSRIVKQDGMCEFEKQVQLRFCLAETICHQDDHFPSNLMVKINNRLLPLPNPIPTNKPDHEPKRPSRPLNITPLIKLSATVANTIAVFWASDQGPGYVLAVELVQKLSSHDLLERLKMKGPMHSDHTRGLIKEKLTEEDAEIVTTHLRVSLMCPLGKMRMRHPCRATTCSHLQCFDSYLYLQMNERKPTWSCPVCDKPALFENLVIDGYFQEVLMSPVLALATNEIELNKDGSWNIQNICRNTGEGDSIEINGDDSLLIAPVRAKTEIIEITISDSDDDDDEQLYSRPESNVVINLDSSSSQSDLENEATFCPDTIYSGPSKPASPMQIETASDKVDNNVTTTTTDYKLEVTPNLQTDFDSSEVAV